jgi:hypothetical protein
MTVKSSLTHASSWTTAPRKHQIRITVGGNLIKYKGDVSTRTADLTTSKLLWNSILSTAGAQYMDIKNFYLTNALDYFEYMKMPLSVFPEWIKEQYDLKTHALHGFVYLWMERAVWGLPQAGILANKLLRKCLNKMNKLLNKLSQFLLCTKWIDESLFDCRVYTTARSQRGGGKTFLSVSPFGNNSSRTVVLLNSQYQAKSVASDTISSSEERMSVWFA